MKKQIKEKLKSGCEESDAAARKARIEKVASILKKVPYKTNEDRLQATLSFARSPLDEQQIESCFKALRSDYMAGEKGVF